MDLGELHIRKQIRFCLYLVKNELNDDQNINNRFINEFELIGTSGPFNEVQEVATRFNLAIGTYIVEVCALENMDGEFLLRFFSEKPKKNE
jgi:hypothetical protein